MTNDEKNLVLDTLNGDSLFNKMALIGDGAVVLPQDCTWDAASGGKIALSADVEFDFASAGDTVYGLTVYASSITLGVASSMISTTFNPALTFAQYDIYTVEGIDLTVE